MEGAAGHQKGFDVCRRKLRGDVASRVKDLFLLLFPFLNKKNSMRKEKMEEGKLKNVKSRAESLVK